MQRFKIADLLIEVTSDKALFFNTFNTFLLNSKDKPDLKIHVEYFNEINAPEGILLVNEDVKWMYKQDDRKIAIYMCEKDSNKIILLLEMDDNWESAYIRCLNSVGVEAALEGIIGSIIFRNFILFHNGFAIHASSIKWNNKGILFSAPSGTGKSTQASLWRDKMSAGILNDDCPVIRSINNQNYVYGTPWSGSSDKFINATASLSAIVVIEQYCKNEIRRLEPGEAVAMLMPRCFLPYYDKSTMNMAIGSIETVISSVPVYLLKCRPDMEAVELVYKCVR